MSETHPADAIPAPVPVAASETAEAQGFSINYRHLFDVAKRYFWVIILYLIAGLVAATVYLVNATPIYRSVARLKVEQRVMEAAPSVTAMANAEDLRGLEMLQTIQLGFVSRSLMQRMVQRMELKNRSDFTKATPLEGKIEEEEFIGYLLKNTQVQLIRGTRLMTISFDHPDPHVAMEMVNALVREYVALEGEQRLAAASLNLSYLIEEKKALEEKLRRSEEQLSDYTKKMGSVSVSGDGLKIIAAQLIELNTRLGVAKAERAKLQSDSEQILKYRDDPKALMEIASVSQLPEIASLRSQLNTLDAELSKARLKYRPGNPQLAQLESQQNALQDALNAEALRAPQTVDRTLQAALQTEDALKQEVDAQEKKVIETKGLSIQSKVLERQIEADNEAYQAVLKRLNEETSQARSQPVFIQVVDAASPASKVKPKPVQVIALAVFLSLAAAAATIFLLASLDTSFKSVDELEAVLGLQVLAAIPQYEMTPAGKGGKSEASGASIALPLLDDPYSAASEAYRTLRAALLLHEDESHSILVSSAVPEEGKSTTSLSLAISMAQRGARTVLIEADLRKPVMQKRLLGESDHRGAADFLSDQADFDEIVQPTQIPNLFVITAGRVNKSSGELLLRRPRVEKLLQLARGEFEQVIVDSAPLLAVSDTLTIARHFKNIALVVRSHKTPRRMVKRAVDLLRRVRREPVGVALSMIPPGNAYYYYGYSEGAGKAYGATHQPSEA
ncbi:MAG TPA: polysaccharide biosynthesis tyrosine autokinase [Chroococcales cyanobacterium]